MTAPKTVQYFGYYLYIVAATLVFVPNILQVPETNEVWIRVLGILVGGLAMYYHRMGQAGSEEFAVTSVYVRIIFVLVSFIALWGAGIGPWQLIIFGVIDALAALWTLSRLRKG
jgi:hypothetical protein